MHAWAEFYCNRCDSLHRVAFKIVAYTKYYQHQPCQEGWQPKDGQVCIHDFAYREARGIKKRWGGTLKSTIYCKPNTTTKTICDSLRKYIIEYYHAWAETLKVEVDFT